MFCPSDENEDVYNDLVKDSIQTVIQGFNATIFAYGQTASGMILLGLFFFDLVCKLFISGKTHTMLGNEADPGIIGRAICDIFEAIENSKEKQFLIRVSYIEIYNENVTDLLVEVSEISVLARFPDLSSDYFFLL